MHAEIDPHRAGRTGMNVADRQHEPLDAASFEELLLNLQHPHLAFGDAADADLVARCEMADWQACAEAMRRVLRRSGLSAEHALKLLKLAGDFTRLHHIRLQGAPWLCTFEMDDDFWIRYDVHTCLDYDHVTIWDNRFDDLLTKHQLNRERFFLRFLDGGPR
ncbi:hypothetical protein [Roseateles chitosanitabidus]|uniref:hypothetical protein n=1 Tax=Roseateles chitosanitabidus TaxID=65048 RepID=UPI0011DFF9C0|nr:hypothetical protein [Roseateles chitosanitabidus]